MKGIILSMKENYKYNIIKNLVDNNGNKNTAALKLGLTRRSIDRLIVNYKQFGKQTFRHKNHDNKPAISINQDTINRIIKLFSSKYSGFNFKHFNEFLKSDEGIFISYSALYNILSSHGFVSCNARRITKRNASSNNIPNNKMDVVDDIIITNNEVNLKDSHPRQERSKYFGELIQMDASNHLWFGTTKAHLHLAIDDATSRIVAAFFDVQETLNGYYNLMYDILTNYGIPYSIFTDKRTIFTYKSLKSKTLDKDTYTQFSFACSLLGIKLDSSSIPQNKGKVERSFSTHQDRLISELTLKGITTIEEANEYLIEYVDKHNKLFALPKKNITSVFDTQPSKEQINLILATRFERTIDKGNCIRFEKQYYQTFENNKLITLRPKTKGMVIKTFDNELYLESKDKIYQLVVLSQHKKISTNFDLDTSIVLPKSKAHKPAIDHPWHHASIQSHQKKFHQKIKTLEEYYDDCIPLESV